MKDATKVMTEQPAPATPGVTKEMVRAHAYRLHRDKLQHEPLSLADWVLAEQDLVQQMQTDEVWAPGGLGTTRWR